MNLEQLINFEKRFVHLLKTFDEISGLPYVHTFDQMMELNTKLVSFQTDLGDLVNEVTMARAVELGGEVMYHDDCPVGIRYPENHQFKVKTNED